MNDYQNFKEFVRVDLKGKRPVGNTFEPWSICSDKKLWYSRVSIRFNFTTKKWERIPAGDGQGDNVIDIDNLTLPNAPY